MNERKSFYRKVIYGGLIALLLFPLSLLSAPETVDSPGGVLAQLRSEYQLSQSNLGDIDPASEAMKLATFGLRGVAVNLLWEKANEFKKVEDWANLAVTLKQLARLQPNFITFWKYQSWNLSYNVSVEFDDYHDRYYWVREGIKFLQQGARYNRDSPDLLWELGWFNGQKIGRSDEKKQYRRLFKADDEIHPDDRTPEQRDNWLVSKMHYLESIAAVDEKGKSLGRKSPSIYYSSAPKSQMSYAEAIEEEGYFDKAVAAWKRAADDWRDYGNILLEHSTGVLLRFNDLDDLTQRINKKVEQLYSLSETADEKVVAEAEANLSDAQREALEVPEAEQTAQQERIAYEAKRILRVSYNEIADLIAEESPEKAREAATLASDLAILEQTKQFTLSYRDTTNFDYWKLRCEFEQDPSAVQARETLFRARHAFRNEADPATAKQLYEEGFAFWDEVFQKYPALRDTEGTTGDDVMMLILDYNKALEQLDAEIPADFPLWYILRDFDIENRLALQLTEHDSRVLNAKGNPGSNDDQVEEDSDEQDASEAVEETPAE